MHLNLDEPSPHALPLDACLVLWLWVSAATLSEETLLVQMVETTDGFESVLGQSMSHHKDKVERSSCLLAEVAELPWE